MHHEKKGDLLVMEFRVFYVFVRFIQVWFNFLVTPGLAGVAVIIIKLVVELARSLEVDQESSAVNNNIHACLEKGHLSLERSSAKQVVALDHCIHLCSKSSN